jgi:hypothetical protein
MKEPNLKNIVAPISRSLVGGKVKIVIHNRRFVELEFEEGKGKLTIIDEEKIVRIRKYIPKRFLKFSFIKGIANIMKSSGYYFEVRDQTGLLVEFGSGVKSITGDVKVKIHSIIKYLHG